MHSSPVRANIDIAAILAEKEDKVRAYIRQKDSLAESLENRNIFIIKIK
jgi:hypothetical protein